MEALCLRHPPEAAQGEIAAEGGASVLLGTDVIDLERAVIELLRKLTVFTSAICPLPYLPDKRCIHAVSGTQDAVRFLGLIPSVRRALDLRIESRSPALPKANISSFSAGVRASA